MSLRNRPCRTARRRGQQLLECLRQVLTEDGERFPARYGTRALDLRFHGDPRRQVAYLRRLTAGVLRYNRHGRVAGEVSTAEAAQTEA